MSGWGRDLKWQARELATLAYSFRRCQQNAKLLKIMVKVDGLQDRYGNRVPAIVEPIMADLEEARKYQDESSYRNDNNVQVQYMVQIQTSRLSHYVDN